MRTCVFACVLVLAACSRTKVTLSPTNPSPRPLQPRVTDSVEIFTTQPPARPYAEVAVLTANWGDPGEDIAHMRERASEYGCDALVVKQLGSSEDVDGRVTSTTPGQPSQAVHGESVSKSMATCVVYTGPASASPM